jgi:hypothetical protein
MTTKCLDVIGTCLALPDRAQATGLAMLQFDRTTVQAGRIVPVAHRSLQVPVGIGLLTCIGLMASPSPLVVLAVGIVIILVVLLLWRPHEPPLLLVPVLLQFMQVALKPVMTTIGDDSLQELADFDVDLEPAALFGLAGVALFAFGLRMGAGGRPRPAQNATMNGWPFSKILRISLFAIVIGHAMMAISGRVGGAQQIVLSLSGIKWAGLFILAYWTLRLKRNMHWLVAVVLLEIVVGMTGFFADFRLVIFVLIGAAIAAYGRITARGLGVISVLAALALILAVFWTSGKRDYREFLNQGTGEQVVLRSLGERVAYLTERVAQFNNEKFVAGFQQLLARVSYIEFLAATMDRVPRVIPHEGGARLGELVSHILTPRILFPDKAALASDTVITAHYTGLSDALLAGENTSISIGYLGELYIDFGVGGALLAVVLIGLIFGACYRVIRDHPSTPAIINYGLCMMFALSFCTFEAGLIRLVGSVLMLAAASMMLQRFVWPVFFANDSGRRKFARGGEA